MELATVSGGRSSSGIVGWINSLFKPAEPREPWVNPFPSDNTQTGAVETLGKVVFAAGVALAAAATASVVAAIAATARR
ncbi:hypothetical protein ACV229_05465 [Burkholderia sp. MR1-5-21]